MKKNLSLLFLLGAVLTVLFVVSGKRAVPLPDDALHADALHDAACLSCHSQGKRSPLETSHPIADRCLTCHTNGSYCHPSQGGVR